MDDVSRPAGAGAATGEDGGWRERRLAHAEHEERAEVVLAGKCPDKGSGRARRGESARGDAGQHLSYIGLALVRHDRSRVVTVVLLTVWALAGTAAPGP